MFRKMIKLKLNYGENLLDQCEITKLIREYHEKLYTGTCKFKKNHPLIS